jgi:hypothetical protein
MIFLNNVVVFKKMLSVSGMDTLSSLFIAIEVLCIVFIVFIFR